MEKYKSHQPLHYYVDNLDLGKLIANENDIHKEGMVA